MFALFAGIVKLAVLAHYLRPMDLRGICSYCVGIIYCFVCVLLLLDYSRPDLFSIRRSSFDSKDGPCANHGSC